MTVLLPGLRADDPLGFLAAIGLVALSEQEELPPLRLGWEDGGAPAARVDGIGSIDELGRDLRETFERLETAGTLIPALPIEFPPRKVGAKGGDPMRMSPDELCARVHVPAHEAWQAGEPWFGRWALAIAALATGKERRGYTEVELTPFYAPSGQMTVRGSIFEKTIQAVREVEGPADALAAWRRTSYDGANFDDRAKRDAGVTTTGESDNQGAPSPTWLAAMGMRFFPLTDNGRRVRAVGWQRVRMYEGFTYRSFVWPAWRPRLDPPAVRTLLGHPALQLTLSTGNGTPRLSPQRQEALAALGVTAVFGSSRRTLQQGDGPLGPARPVWRADG